MKTLLTLALTALTLIGCGTTTDPSVQGSNEGLTVGMCRDVHDCRAPIAHICKVCADGTTACGHWSCVSNQCELETCPTTPPPPPACKAASDCNGPLPLIACQVCHDGTTQCPHHTCVNGTCGIEVCPPVPPKPECTIDSDCHGILPQLCELCPDGHTSCAHFACVAGQCQTQVCL